jgi:hypothetical protein
MIGLFIGNVTVKVEKIPNVICDGNPPVIREKRKFANVIRDYHLNP